MSPARAPLRASAGTQPACRILLLNERDPRHPRAGGAETHVFEIMSRLVRRGHAVTQLAASFPGGAARERVDGVEVLRLGGVARYYPAAALRCARETHRGRFDVVVECLNKLPYFSPLYAGVPVLALCHHLFGETAFAQAAWPIAATVFSAEKLLPLAYRRQRFLAISESSRSDLVARGIACERIDVSLPGIRRPRVTPRPLRERPPLVSYVGRLEPYKRVDVMLRALAPLVAGHPALEIAVIGRGSDRERIERTSRELGLDSRTRMLGFLDDDERDRWLADSRVCVCPSEKEGWGLTVIEANAVGTPVVASDAPGLRDSVRHGETGWLVPVGDVAAFGARIAELLAADERAEAMALRGLDWSRRFDWDVAALEMEAAIERARGTA
jgi:glycosyltransferase involved in cell wall biosynthesis